MLSEVHVYSDFCQNSEVNLDVNMVCYEKHIEVNFKFKMVCYGKYINYFA